ncbi:glycogen/starch synthase [Pyrofollis japonicus]|uniref:glycogen/starch synthase n=1 Tax=Pyrofollis japonicus TaxID=3060460 RepID=UPI00295AD819|nr:glycogen/starch synthase [Pyrofollis japonicus]
MPLYAPPSIHRVWHITFEYPRIAKVGGLAEAVRSMVRGLVSRGYDVTVIMPSHGVHLNPNRGFWLRALDFEASGTRIGIDGSHYHYRIGAEEARLDGARIILFKGLDTSTGLVFDAPYPYDNAEEKAALLTRAVTAFAEQHGLPDLVHVHDWPTVLAGVALKDLGERKGLAIPLVYTIHLSGGKCFPWHYASEAWSGLQDRLHPVWRVVRHEYLSYRQLWDSLGGCLEAFGVHESDLFTTVSYGYLDELLKKYGEWLRPKTCVVYNSTDWRVDEVREWLRNRYGTDDRRTLRWRLVVEAQQQCSDKWGWIEPGDGPLYITSGRMTSQKGFDIALQALEYEPRAKLLVLGLPVGDHGYEAWIRGLAAKYSGRAAVLKCRLDPMMYKALFYVATGFVAASRWEPFGIVAVESLAVGTPVIASAVGGLKEIVIDLRRDPVNGTGLLVEPENPWALGDAMRTLANIVEYSELSERVRENCVRRVDTTFRIGATTTMLLRCYEKARQMAYYRAHA